MCQEISGDIDHGDLHFRSSAVNWKRGIHAHLAFGPEELRTATVDVPQNRPADEGWARRVQKWECLQTCEVFW